MSSRLSRRYAACSRRWASRRSSSRRRTRLAMAAVPGGAATSAATSNTAALASGAVPLAGGVQSFPAPSYCLDHLHGGRWRHRRPCDPGRGAHTVAPRHAQYLAQRQQYYGWEQRWPAAPFWRQLHAGAQVPPSMPPRIS